LFEISYVLVVSPPVNVIAQDINETVIKVFWGTPQGQYYGFQVHCVGGLQNATRRITHNSPFPDDHEMDGIHRDTVRLSAFCTDLTPGALYRVTVTTILQEDFSDIGAASKYNHITSTSRNISFLKMFPYQILSICGVLIKVTSIKIWWNNLFHKKLTLSKLQSSILCTRIRSRCSPKFKTVFFFFICLYLLYPAFLEIADLFHQNYKFSKLKTLGLIVCRRIGSKCSLNFKTVCTVYSLDYLLDNISKSKEKKREIGKRIWRRGDVPKKIRNNCKSLDEYLKQRERKVENKTTVASPGR